MIQQPIASSIRKTRMDEQQELEQVHASDDCGLEVRPSRIPSAGSGLFTNRAFASGSVVCTYTGDVYERAAALHLADKSYLMKLGNGTYVDARTRPDVLARYINDCRGRLGGYNVVFDKQPDMARALVVALRDIAEGEELFVDYGRMYWLAYNLLHPDARVK